MLSSFPLCLHALRPLHLLRVRLFQISVVHVLHALASKNYPVWREKKPEWLWGGHWPCVVCPLYKDLMFDNLARLVTHNLINSSSVLLISKYWEAGTPFSTEEASGVNFGFRVWSYPIFFLNIFICCNFSSLLCINASPNEFVKFFVNRCPSFNRCISWVAVSWW